MSDNADSLQSIDELTKRFNNLNDQKVRADENLKNAQKQLQQLQADAKEQFGTSDLNELKGMLKKMEAENERLQSDYQKHLDQLESELKSVEDSYTESQEELD